MLSAARRIWARLVDWLFPRKKELPKSVVSDSGGKELPWCEACRCWHPVGTHYPPPPPEEPVDSANVWAQWNRDHR